MRRFLAILTFLLSSVIFLYSADIKGCVKDIETSIGIQGVIIFVKTMDGQLISATTSDDSGFFKFVNIAFKEEDSYKIEFRLLGYLPHIISSPFTNDIEVYLEKKEFALDEVVVSPDIVEKKGDTILYYAPDLVEVSDRNLGDVLNKLTGVEVDLGGYVTYNGRKISRLYLEGNDLLENNYNIATKNINPEDVLSIEIYEHHQHVKALQGIVEPEAAAINIRLKSKAKNKWLANLQGTFGAKIDTSWAQYSAGAFLMNLSSKFQTMNTAKVDASGNNILTSSLMESMEAISFNRRYIPEKYLFIGHTSPPIAADRTKFNTTYSITSDNKFNASENLKIGVKGRYEHDYQDSYSNVIDVYFKEDSSSVTFNEHNAINTVNYKYTGEVNAELNTEKVYLNEKFRIEGFGLSGRNHLSGSNILNQRVNNSYINLLNSLSFLFNTPNNSVFSFSNLTQYSEQDEMLSIDKETTQTIDAKYFYNVFYFSNAIKIAPYWTLSLNTSIPYFQKWWLTDLTGIKISNDYLLNDVLENNVDLFYIKPTENIYFLYERKKVSLTLSADLWYQLTNYTIDNNKNISSFAINPYLSFKYSINQMNSFSLMSGFYRSSIDESKIYTGLILRGYNMMTKGREEILQYPTWSVSSSYTYNNPLSGWYVKGDIRYSYSNMFSNNRYLLDNYIVNVESNELSALSNISANIKLSKTFIELKSKISADLGYSYLTSNIMQNEIVYPYDVNSYTAMIIADIPFARWLNLKYTGSYTHQTINIFSNKTHEQSLSNDLTLSFIFGDILELDLVGEHYYSKYSNTQPRQSVFFDVSLWYFASDRLQFFIHAKNLLNVKEYSYSQISPLNSSYYSYKIRPFNIMLGVQVNL